MGDSKSTDLLGLAPYGEAIKVVAQASVDGLGAVLGRICLPAAEEVGLAFRDRVAGWRKRNATLIALKADQLLAGAPGLHAHPRSVLQIVEHGSLTDDAELQEMWAGLLASSCSADGQDESNLIFIGLLSGLTSSQVRMLNDVCEKSNKRLTSAGWLMADREIYTAGRLVELTGISDFHRIDRELDHLRSLGLLGERAGFLVNAQDKIADLTPTTLGLQMFARCCGSRESPEAFFKLSAAP